MGNLLPFGGGRARHNLHGFELDTPLQRVGNSSGKVFVFQRVRQVPAMPLSKCTYSRIDIVLLQFLIRGVASLQE